MSFTDGKRRIATADDLKRRWGGGFMCGLCGQDFKEGDGYRWQYGSGRTYENNGKTWGIRNFLVCDSCDGADVLDRWISLHQEFYSPRFRALRPSL